MVFKNVMKHKITCILSFATALLFLTGCSTERSAVRWEYKAATTNAMGAEQMDSFLNGLAKDGWIYVEKDRDSFCYIFKRAKP